MPLDGVWVGPAEEPARFERLEHVGGGAEGVVHRARFVGRGNSSVRVVALKEYRRPAGAPREWPHDGTWAQLSDQAGLLIGLPDHPHLVRLQGVFLGAISSAATDRDPSSSAKAFATPFVVMDWVEGRSPLEELAARPVSLGERLGWVRDLASAVDLLHSVTRTAGNPIVHGDIKPGNCLITAARGLVLVDTGALTRLDATATHRGLCSPPYAAPEVVAAPGRPRRVAADLYSVGALAFLLITGEPPPDAGTPGHHGLASEILERQQFEGVAAVEADAVRAALLTYLAPDPAIRETINPVVWARRLSERLDPPAAPTPSRSRRRVMAALAATATAAIGAVLIVRPGPLGADTLVPAPSSTASLTSTDDFQVFGRRWATFPATTGGSSLTITPPSGEGQWDHLWGFYSPGGRCAAKVEFDAVLRPGPGSENFGLAVAPRSSLKDDQPTGASIQYEWEGADVADQAGSYLRPAQLPGGAWDMVTTPVPAPDIRQRHHVVVEALGTTLTASIDGKQLAEFDAPAVECGGMSIRVWGATAEINRLSISGS